MLGLMQRVRELYVGEATAVSYNFLHLTVQEYLAAFHLSQQPVEKQIERFKKYKQAKVEEWRFMLTSVEEQIKGQQEERHFHMVLRFLCGITQFKEYSNEQLNKFLIKDYFSYASSVICEVSLMSVVKSVNNSHAKRAAKIWTLVFLAVRRRSHCTSASNWDSKAWKFSHTECKSYACALRYVPCRILLQQFETTEMSNTLNFG